MSGYLRVGPIVAAELNDGVARELLSTFSEDMLERVLEPWDDVYDNIIVRFRAPGRHIRERLDVLGIDGGRVIALLDKKIEGMRKESVVFKIDEQHFFDFRQGFYDPIEEVQPLVEESCCILQSLNAASWVSRLASAPTEADQWDIRPGSRTWLMRLLEGWGELHVLRILLHALPDAEVSLDVTDLLIGSWGRDDREALIARVSEIARGTPVPPLIVLTEGKTDAEFIGAAIKVLYPHLADIIRFPDFGLKPEGGVSALVRSIKAFAAAGVANNTVAVFDNDSAAADGIKLLKGTPLPANICVMRYPDLEFARHYPTLGPPTVDSPRGSLAFADVNGLAGSIELYLGRDVLASQEGPLRPVMWKSYINGVRCYQGEVIGKPDIQAAFRAKVEEVQRNPQAVQRQDWDGLRLIVQAIISSFGQEKSEPSG